MTNDFKTINVPGKKSNQTPISDADREILTLGSTDNAGSSVNLVSGIILLPSYWDFSVCIGGRWQILFLQIRLLLKEQADHRKIEQLGFTLQKYVLNVSILGQLR